MNARDSGPEAAAAGAPETAPEPCGIDVIRARLAALPDRPGVYRMSNAAGEVIYVGKARSLRKRVASYTRFGGHTNRIARMIAETAELTVITTESETEALLLEANYIKRFRPRYNVLLRDDKSFPHILLTGDHDFPQLMKHRGARARPGRYFGPFASAGSVARTLNALQRAFLLRSCSDSVFANRTRPCLLYQIKRCSAPCVGRIDAADYGALVAEAEAFLSGRSRAVADDLARRMEAAAEALDFETAALYRDRVRALAHIQSRQGINPQGFSDADLFAIHAEGGQSCVQVFFYRGGQNWGHRAYFPRHDRSVEAGDVLDAFLGQFYDEREPPPLILISKPIENAGLIAEALSLRADRKVEIACPQRGEKRAIMEQALGNARDELARRLAEGASQRRMLDSVAEVFGLDAAPRRIEIYDNSHLQSANAVGAMVVAGPDGFLKKEYRRFNMKGERAAGDDFAMMREMLSRRFARLLKEEPQESETPAAGEADGGELFEEAGSEAESETPAWPDLVLIDGGAGQLSAVRGALGELGVTGVPIVAIAKGPDRDAGRERFFMEGRGEFLIDPKSPAFHYLQRLRDEAHRFAIGAHRAKRAKAQTANPLDDVPGIGAARKRALLNHFGSARAVARAGLADLEAVEGVSKALAKTIHDHFRKG